MDDLNRRIVACRACPRLNSWRDEAARTAPRRFSGDTYWSFPVPNFGDPAACGLIVGLAPAAHGANRTGRMFTGDKSGEWLYRALHRAGLASAAESTSRDDGLQLRGVMITAVCHCAPPGNKPLPGEIAACKGFLAETLASRPWRAVLCLGSLSWDQTHRALGGKPKAKFSHGAESRVGDLVILSSYHPSQQNTFTGVLTEPMFDGVVRRFAALIS